MKCISLYNVSFGARVSQSQHHIYIYAYIGIINIHVIHNGHLFSECGCR